jgi:hypothetical protein
MREPEQDEPLDIGGNLGWCRGCGLRRVLCSMGLCTSCHQTHPPAGRADDQPGHLCHGWYATGPLLEPWTCPTCLRVVPYRP